MAQPRWRLRRWFVRAPAAPVAAVVVALSLPRCARGQEGAPPGWRVSAGGGVAATVHRGDDGGDGPLAGVARAGFERGSSSGLGVAVEWIGAWLPGDHGGESRHHVGVTGTLGLGGGPLRGRLGLGLGTATVVETEGGSAGGLPGDLSVGIGGYGSLDGLLGLEGRASLGGGVAILPAVELLVQRAGGFTLVTGLVTARLRIGG